MSERRVTSMGVGILNAAIVERDSGGTKGECGFLRCTVEDRSCENLEIRGGIAKKVEALIASFRSRSRGNSSMSGQSLTLWKDRD